MAQANPFQAQCLQSLNVGSKTYQFYNINSLNDGRIQQLPYSIRVLLECAVRNCDEFSVKSTDVEKILDWQNTSGKLEVPFKPSRVLLQDFTGVPAVVDLASMRDAMVQLGGDPQKINPACPADLVIDHSVTVDVARMPEALARNQEIEFDRNRERFEFLKWGQNAFRNFLIVPPGSGIVHQVNLEYLARSVFEQDGLLYPDSVVGTDSHTTMINGLGVVGWGVGGIEAEAVMLGETIYMVLPEVVGFKLTGRLNDLVTATDLVLTITKMLRERGVVEKFVEFFGPGLSELTLADRATIANMSPEYGATMGFFPSDQRTIDYLRNTGRNEENLEFIEAYLRAQGLYFNESDPEPTYSGQIMELDLSTVVPCVAGPKRPQDKVSVSDVKADFEASLTKPLGFKGFGLQSTDTTVNFEYQGEQFTLTHGSVVIAAITSCTNTSNPDVMIGAGILAKNAVEKGLTVPNYIKTSLSPGSGVVTQYLQNSGVIPYLEQLGFYLAGYGCMTCIGNSGDLDENVANAINSNNLVVASVLSGNRNFEGRVNPFTQANYLASPPLVVAYALAGKMNIDFETEPLGEHNGQQVFLRDIWPSKQQIKQAVEQNLRPEMFREVYNRIAQGTDRWNQLQAIEGSFYQWKNDSTYIHNPPFFAGITPQPPQIQPIDGAYVLLNLGDSITTDHISPAGKIARGSPAARFLEQNGVASRDFNSYGARRGNDLVMERGTFANIRIFNKLVGEAGPKTVHLPTGQTLDIHDAAKLYNDENNKLIILAGKEYGSGSSRDWAAKGPYLLGIKAVIAESFERIHRSNLVGMGILPLVYQQGQTAESLGLTGRERYTIHVDNDNLQVHQNIRVTTDDGKEFTVVSRLNTDVEIEYYKNRGILPYVLRKISRETSA